MNAEVWKREIMLAAAAPNSDRMQALTEQLDACSRAKEMLRHKGYGESGQAIDVMAQMVPENLMRMIFGK